LNKITFYIASILILVFTSLSYQLSAQKKQKAFIDTLDNALDVSYYLSNLNGLLPIVSPITEPAVGYGAVGAGLFFIEKKEYNKEKINKIDVGVTAAIGYRMWKGTGWSIAAKYNYGFIDVYKDIKGTKNNAFYIELNIPIGAGEKPSKKEIE